MSHSGTLDQQRDDMARRNRRSGLIAAAGALGMIALGYASVPLYEVFCRVTGYGGTTQVASAAGLSSVQGTGQPITIRFDSNTDLDLPWYFEPEVNRNRITIGERALAIYEAENLSNAPITGTASFNVTPVAAGRYFVKIECFCFTQQTLQPGQRVRMPVQYYVDPAIMDDPEANDIEEITLSYTFHEVDQSINGG